MRDDAGPYSSGAHRLILNRVEDRMKGARVSNPQKRWSLGSALGRGIGGAIPAALTGAYVGSLGGPLGAPLGAAIGGVTAFASGFVGAALGYRWDDPFGATETFGSAALYVAVVGGVISATLGVASGAAIATAAQPGIALAAIASLSGFLGSISRSLIDDWRAQAALARHRRLGLNEPSNDDRFLNP
jgi:hypothetical protein